MLTLKTQYSVLRRLEGVFNRMLWVSIILYANLCLGARVPRGLDIWLYSLLYLMWTAKSGPDLPVCAVLRAGGGEHQLQNSEWEGNTCCHVIVCTTAEPAYPPLDMVTDIPGHWQTVDNNLIVSFHHDAARWSMHLLSYQQGGAGNPLKDHWGANTESAF